jgi:hypothetical protein
MKCVLFVCNHNAGRSQMAQAFFERLAPEDIRVFSNTFAGIAPTSVPGFVIAQLIGGSAAILALRALYPEVTPADAAAVVVPHQHERGVSDASVEETVAR